MLAHLNMEESASSSVYSTFSSGAWASTGAQDAEYGRRKSHVLESDWKDPTSTYVKNFQIYNYHT